MRLVEKSDITPQLVSELVATQFPLWADLPVSPVPLDGWDNTTFRLGNDMLVRLPSAERYVAQVEKEHHWLPRLAGQLPLPIPRPLARGVPGSAYPFPWSVYRWLSGEPASAGSVQDLVRFAADLAAFLSALYRIDSDGGPDAGPHSFFRGGPVATYEAEARAAIAALTGVIDARAAGAVWDAAVSAPQAVIPVWVHGDVAGSNLLVVDGHLSAAIDFGCSAVGDPACDLVVAWTFFTGESRQAFRAALAFDDATWARARGWALWKAAITLAREQGSDPDAGSAADRWGWRLSPQSLINDLLADARSSA
jgi:aminoglycoside phosphotransferase (APT) family kinase protein